MKRRSTSPPIVSLIFALCLSALVVHAFRRVPPRDDSSATVSPSSTPSPTPSDSGISSEDESWAQRLANVPPFQHGQPVAGKPVDTMLHGPNCLCPPVEKQPPMWLVTLRQRKGYWLFCPNPKKLSPSCGHLVQSAESGAVRKSTAAAAAKLHRLLGADTYYVIKPHYTGTIRTGRELSSAELDQIELWIAITENHFRPAEAKIVKELSKATGLAPEQIKLTFPPPDGTVGEIDFWPY